MLGLLGTVLFFSQISVGAWSEYTCINMYLEPKCYENNMIVVVSPSLLPYMSVQVYYSAFSYIIVHIKVESQNDFSLICLTDLLPLLSVAFC